MILNSKKVVLILFLVILIFSTILRFYGLGTRSISGDESVLAVMFSQKNVRDLLNRPVEHFVADTKLHAGYPPLFMISEYYLSVLLGYNEFALRILPLTFSIASVILIYLLSLLLTKNKYISILSMSLTGFSTALIYFSKELKQYSGEVFFAISLFYFAERYFQNNSRKWIILLIITSLIAIGFSYTSIITILTIIFLFMLKILRKTNSEEKLHGICYILIIGISYIFNYFKFIKVLSENIAFAQSTNLTGFPQNFKQFFGWFLSNLIRFLTFLFSGKTEITNLSATTLVIIGAFFLLFCLSSILLLFEKNKRLFVYTILPFSLTILVAILHKFPFAGQRYNLYLAPMIFICIAYGIVYFLNYIKKFNTKLFYVVFATILILLAIPAINAERNMFKYPNPIYPNSGMRELVKEYLDERNPEDITYIFYNAKLEFKYYYENYYKQNYTNVYLSEGNKWYSQVEWENNTRTYKNHLEYYMQTELFPIINKYKNERIWIFFSEGLTDSDTVLIRAHMQNLCKESKEYGKYDARAYTYDCREIINKYINIYKIYKGNMGKSYSLLLSINDGPWMQYSLEEKRVIDEGPFLIKEDGEIVRQATIYF